MSVSLSLSLLRLPQSSDSFLFNGNEISTHIRTRAHIRFAEHLIKVINQVEKCIHTTLPDTFFHINFDRSNVIYADTDKIGGNDEVMCTFHSLWYEY